MLPGLSGSLDEDLRRFALTCCSSSCSCCGGGAGGLCGGGRRHRRRGLRVVLNQGPFFVKLVQEAPYSH